jgi:hypothetical protein
MCRISSLLGICELSIRLDAEAQERQNLGDCYFGRTCCYRGSFDTMSRPPTIDLPNGGPCMRAVPFRVAIFIPFFFTARGSFLGAFFVSRQFI